MADEVAGLDLEDGPAPVAAAPEPPPPAEPAAPEPPPDPDDAISTVVAGEKLVPLSALIGEREKRQQLEPLRAKVEELEHLVRTNQPYVQFLQAHPELLQARPPQNAPSAPPDPNADPEAIEAAKLYEFWTTDAAGKPVPDANKGAMHLRMVRQEAQRIAQAINEPDRQARYLDMSNNNFRQALALRDANGQPMVDEKLLRSAWQNVPAQNTADPNVAAALVATVVGATYMNAKPRVQPPATPPLVTEASGGAGRAPVRMTAIETAVAKDRGMTDKQWSERTRGFTPGRASDLE